jgi:hypothetical protein
LVKLFIKIKVNPIYTKIRNGNNRIYTWKF